MHSREILYATVVTLLFMSVAARSFMQVHRLAVSSSLIDVYKRQFMRRLEFSCGLVIGLYLEGFWVMAAKTAHSDKVRSETSLPK